MDAVIMAAGRGSRLGSHTDERPKALVDLGGVTPLELQIGLLIARGLRGLTIVTGYRRDLVEAAASRAAAGRVDLQFVWNPFWPISNVAGSAWMARERLRGPFLYLHADTLVDPSILDDLIATDAPAALPIDFRPCEPEQMKARVEDGVVKHLSKSLPDDETAGEFVGIGLFREDAVPAIRSGLDAVLDAGDFGAYFEAAINHAIDEGLRVAAVPTGGRRWVEIDFEEDLQLARSLLPFLMPPSTAR